MLAVVPARGGSKSVPGKNLRTVGGLSLVARAARVTGELSWLDGAVLSTDDPMIAEEGLRHGLSVPALRPAELATDTALSIDVWRHAWLEAERVNGMHYDVSILLEPTSPMREPADVVATLDAMIDGGHASAATVSRTPGHCTPHKTLTIGDEGVLAFYLSEGARYSLRQSIPKYYHRNGICYAARRETVVDAGLIIEKGCRAVVVDRPVVNVDEEIDLRFAEFLLAGMGSPR
ncbi:acylneuraminate cytidylyltransferase family protein [Arenibaculum sp.]|uniref:acylneuraminate cytidylyltransferase family protein n=1 Tax=Arenibaculum sp. TaxID=2865862 RepID=UPI002E0D7242|nr:acylneuraminate cytidylyltransferase family protein [Arenibaculum sp.]